jgi:hypothetical protein
MLIDPRFKLRGGVAADAIYTADKAAAQVKEIKRQIDAAVKAMQKTHSVPAASAAPQQQSGTLGMQVGDTRKQGNVTIERLQ